MSNYQAGYARGVEAAAITVEALRDTGKTPDEIAAAIRELADRLKADQDSQAR
ncbi:hypothetical protein ACFVZC_17310 [Streptomyces marokkonensis]|uniref:Uncharacterized protein n=1 Tax=Streptomyces marokkonensis TaxID=324855 RepID=A0ABW6Q7G7_9ACTN